MLSAGREVAGWLGEAGLLSMQSGEVQLASIALTALYSRAFAHVGDGFDSERDRLKGALDRMRENVAALVKTIPADCKDLTVHDVTHLDALWEMASIIAGDDLPLNPAEAFVLGGAILLHDAGMSAAAFPGGLEELKSTDEWKDIAAAVLREREFPVTSANVHSPPENLLPSIKFEVLRTLHAEQAEKMATASWTLPDGDTLTLLEDHELRIALGASVGRIAHSHHWDIEKLAEQLLDNVGCGTAFPAAWSINEKKIGCLLRCADACHIDRRRAPAILLASTKPTGVSAAHWIAQTKINKPALRDGTLIYTSGSTYKQSEAAAWWVAYDLINLADKEIRSSNALIEEMGLPAFKVSRVLGAGSPRALSKHLRPDGWRPIDAEVRVTDPVHLARTLGGSRLYGDDALAPIRELLQNSTDAVRATRLIEERPEDWGVIGVTIEPCADDEKACWLHVDDDGVGMTERVLSGPLIDFGKSIWNSSLLRDEFPGLQAKNIKPIGKFGIGFFSVFELGDEVRVISRKFDSALNDAKCLEFRSLSSRPIIRPASKGELPRDVRTRVSVKVRDKTRLSGGPIQINGPYARAGQSQRSAIGPLVKRLVAMLDVRVVYKDQISEYAFEHHPDIYMSDPEVFLTELLPFAESDVFERLLEAHGPLLTPLFAEDGTKIGRAAIQTNNASKNQRSYGSVAVGGFVYSNSAGLRVPYVGVLEGETYQAARQTASPKATPSVIAKWASQQAVLIDQSRYLASQLMEVAEHVIDLGGESGPLPYCFSGNKNSTWAEAAEKIRNLDRVLIPAKVEYDNWFRIVGYGDLGSNYFNLNMRNDVLVLREGSDRLLEEDIAREIKRGGIVDFGIEELRSPNRSLVLFHGLVSEVWNEAPLLSFEEHAVFDVSVFTPPQPRWTLAIRKR